MLVAHMTVSFEDFARNHRQKIIRTLLFRKMGEIGKSLSGIHFARHHIYAHFVPHALPASIRPKKARASVSLQRLHEVIDHLMMYAIKW